MSHVAEGSLQAYIDGEIGSAESSALREHLAVCAVCSDELATLRHTSDTLHSALVAMDVRPPMLRARARIAAEGRRRPAGRFARVSAAGFAKAAMLLIALAGAVSAAIPNSPVRRALEATYARVVQLMAGADTVAIEEVVEVPATEPAQPVAARVTENISVTPSNGRISIVLHPPAGAVEVTVRMVDGSRAHIQTSMTDEVVRFVRGTGRVEVGGMGSGEVTIELPRGLQAATVVVGNAVAAELLGEQLQLRGPAGAAQGSEVRFRIGS
jgi:hypothetical protein